MCSLGIDALANLIETVKQLTPMSFIYIIHSKTIRIGT